MIVNLSKNKNFAIKGVSGGKVTLNSSDGNFLFSSTVDKTESSREIVGFADQIVTLYDGKILKRIRDSIFIE